MAARMREVGCSAEHAIPRSSNGRTAAFGAVNRGSNPCRGATLIRVENKEHNSPVFFLALILSGLSVRIHAGLIRRPKSRQLSPDGREPALSTECPPVLMVRELIDHSRMSSPEL